MVIWVDRHLLQILPTYPHGRHRSRVRRAVEPAIRFTTGGRLAEIYYRELRDHRQADEVATDRGNEDIAQGYDTDQDDTGKNVLLFSNGRDFVERAGPTGCLPISSSFRDAPAEVGVV